VKYLNAIEKRIVPLQIVGTISVSITIYAPVVIIGVNVRVAMSICVKYARNWNFTCASNVAIPVQNAVILAFIAVVVKNIIVTHVFPIPTTRNPATKRVINATKVTVIPKTVSVPWMLV
jgi:hypothetical protein